MPGKPDFETLFEVLPNAYMVVDRELRYVAANRAYLRETASRLEDLLGHSLFELFPNDPSDPANVPATLLRQSFERVLTTGAPDTIAFIPYRVPREVDGAVQVEERFWSATHVPLLDARGGVEHIVQHTVDVTALRALAESASALPTLPPGLTRAQVEAGVLSRAQAVQAEKIAVDAERRTLEAMFDQAPGFMCFLEGPEHVFTLANRAYARLVGEREVRGKTVREALPEVAEQGFVELLDRVFRTGEPYVGSGTPVSLRRHEGGPLEDFFIDFIYQPVSDRHGKVRGIFVQGSDVTKRVKAERETEEARRVAEAFSQELLEQSRTVEAALTAANARIRELETRLAEAK